MDIQGNSILGKGKGQDKDLEVRECLMYLRNIKEIYRVRVEVKLER